MALEATAGKVVVNHWAKMEEFSAYLLNDVNKKKLPIYYYSNNKKIIKMLFWEKIKIWTALEQTATSAEK